MNATAYRLPRNVTPRAYEIALHASPRRQGFAGAVEIEVAVHAACDAIELHARGLTVRQAAVLVDGERRAVRVVPHPERETLGLHLEAALQPGTATVELLFAGQLNPGMHGLYLASDGREKAIVSQCEATDARAIFPCFDEPDLKATLRWRVRTEPGWTVITNGVPQSRRRLPGHTDVVHSFAPTRVISTYLAAVTIGAFEASPKRLVAGTPCRVLAGPGRRAQTAFAQQVTAQVLPWYEAYFGHKYNYQKLDQVAVPGFDAGAMENVGAIFYRQSLLLMTAGATSWQGQKRIAEVIAHEIAHQWFGNLVTMRWWDDLWLNEAFATWVAYKACDAWRPEWRIWDDYLESKEAALVADALHHTHPIYTEVHSPAEATELFDVITYEKGCGVLRMAEGYLGADVFRRGMQLYQAAFKDGNATGAELWAKLGEAAGKQPGSLTALMQSWTLQPGFPLLKVALRQRGAKAELVIGQRRFAADAKAMQGPPSAQLWQVPLVVDLDAGQGPQQTRALLTGRDTVVPLPGSGKIAWVYPNASALGFYRLQLDPACLQLLLDGGLKQLTPAARSGLLEDQWALVHSGLAPVQQFMDVLRAYADERDHAVVRVMVGRLHALREGLARRQDWAALGRFCRWLLGPQLEALGWEGGAKEAPPQALRRALVVGALGAVGEDAAVRQRAAELMAAESRRPDSVERNLAGTVVALAARDGDAKRLAAYVKVYLARRRQGLAPALQQRYLGALAHFERPEVAAKVLQLCLDGTVPQDQLRSLLGPLLAQQATGVATWAFLKAHWKVLGPKVGAMGVSRLVEATGALPHELRREVAAFFEEHRVEEARRALAKALEAMALRHALVSREARALGDWLQRGPQPA